MTRKTYRDSNGKALADYPHPSVAVDTAVLTLDENFELLVLQVRRANGPGWALPGTFLYQDETLADAVERSLLLKANVQGLRPRQLHVFDAPDRDDRGWVLSVAHLAVVQGHQLESRWPTETRLVPARAPGRLWLDHPKIIEYAIADMQRRYAKEPDPEWLLGEEFTLRELRLAHEAVAGAGLQRDKFRRAMKGHLGETETTIVSGRGRPAELFRRRDSTQA